MDGLPRVVAPGVPHHVRVPGACSGAPNYPEIKRIVRQSGIGRGTVRLLSLPRRFTPRNDILGRDRMVRSSPWEFWGQGIWAQQGGCLKTQNQE